VLDLFQGAGQRCLQIALEEIPDRRGMNDNFSGHTVRHPLFGGIAGDEHRSVHQVVKLVIRPRDDTFRKQNQRALRLDKDPHRTF